MTRNTMLVYLKNLRDLEVAKYKLEASWNQQYSRYDSETKKLQQETERIQKENFKAKPSIGCQVIFWGIIVLAVLHIGVAVYLLGEDRGFLGVALLVIGCIWLFFACLVYSDMRDERKKNKEAREHNRKERLRLDTVVPGQIQENKQRLQKEKTAIDVYRQRIKPEYAQVCQLLKGAYSLNIVPGQYRNLASIYYIYDYMSTSQATFEETLIHEHMENGIQRILEKLDTIIAQNEELILHARRIEANTHETADNTRRILENEQRMLASMEQTEQNTADAAQAASVAAQYSAANAFFSAAQYIDSQRGR